MPIFEYVCRECSHGFESLGRGATAVSPSMGMELTGKPNREGIPVIDSYAGPGQDRVVLRKKLSQGGGV